MDWSEALDLVVKHTRHEAYRKKCADEHPEHSMWRAQMIKKAAELEGREPPVEYPPLIAQAGNLVGAVGRAVGAAIRGDAVTVPDDVLAERKAICAACPQFDACASRCRLCGCYTKQKQRLATEQCPLDPPRWGRWEKPPTEPERPVRLAETGN